MTPPRARIRSGTRSAWSDTRRTGNSPSPGGSGCVPLSGRRSVRMNRTAAPPGSRSVFPSIRTPSPITRTLLRLRRLCGHGVRLAVRRRMRSVVGVRLRGRCRAWSCGWLSGPVRSVVVSARFRVRPSPVVVRVRFRVRRRPWACGYAFVFGAVCGHAYSPRPWRRHRSPCAPPPPAPARPGGFLTDNAHRTPRGSATAPPGPRGGRAAGRAGAAWPAVRARPGPAPPAGGGCGARCSARR